MTRVAVLGGGNGSHAAVVELTIRGHEVRWWRRDAAAFPGAGRIRYDGTLGDGVVEPAATTDDLAAAVSGAAVVLCPLPATVQTDLLARLAPVLAAGQVVVFTPGTFGTWLGARRRPDVTFMETGTLPYLARMRGPGHVAVPVLATRLPVGSIPGTGERADAAHAAFSALFPSAVRVSDGFDAALLNWGPVLHPPAVVHNLGAIESLGDRFDIHSEGTSDAVRRAILALDEERIALREHLGVPAEHWPIRWHYEGSPKSMYGADAKARLIASGIFRESLHLEHRYIEEDIALGLVLLAALGRVAGCPLPHAEALLTVAGKALGRDLWAQGRTLAALGTDDLDEVRERARHGF
jgi:opine dehydrogenase